jgi:hypothetical protein
MKSSRCRLFREPGTREVAILQAMVAALSKSNHVN